MVVYERMPDDLTGTYWSVQQKAKVSSYHVTFTLVDPLGNQYKRVYAPVGSGSGTDPLAQPDSNGVYVVDINHNTSTLSYLDNMLSTTSRMPAPALRAFFFGFFFGVFQVLELPFARVKGREQVCDSRVRCQGCGLGEQPCESCAHFGRSNSRTCCREGVCWPVITDRAVPLGVDEIALSSRCRREQRTEIKMASLAKERVPMVD